MNTGNWHHYSGCLDVNTCTFNNKNRVLGYVLIVLIVDALESMY